VADAEGVVRREGQRDRAIAGPELLGDERGGERVDAGAAVLGRDRQSGEPDRRELREEGHRERPLLAPLRRARDDAIADELANGVADGELVVPVAEVH
jgi:hypothetical protein